MITKHNIAALGSRFQLFAQDDYMREAYLGGRLQEHHMLEWIIAHVRPGGLWVDVGACNGQHALAFSLLADIVMAIEPIPENFEILMANIGLNPSVGRRVVPLRIGAGAFKGTAGSQQGGHGQPSQWQLATKDVGDIIVLPLDSMIPQEMDVRLIKIDVEGMEEDVITGALSTIERCRPELFVEIWKEEDMRSMERLLARSGYKLIERYNPAPTYHFSASAYPVTYRQPA